ncbi:MULTISPECIES: type II toxin-antitoxin system PemK/MazF family toxin [unclassified Methylobacterium]|uniref:type II toxin-antitoxin system PemK/MazF family toxin n=1 Tax=unclassified Methylobacterium TaxID=2615210 RepID=UPI000701FEB8|nr:MULTISPECIES: type II toxin-antitoxin system PemK/MazF family toxin [unclassified Methylobacterium]KQP58786.1 hypothetical protein ASF39_17430 [Methylobacterium sp. Leaf108]KQT88656.1 hypothetical protein ASG59_15725 [Methylobacterium sp. Leaf466]
MTDFERFDVVTALFPFLDVPRRKPRPVLVLSAKAFNALHGHVVGAMITTGAASHWPSDHVIHDLAPAGLSHRSVIRWKVFTLPFAEIGRRIGHLSETDRRTFGAACEAILPGSPVRSGA